MKYFRIFKDTEAYLEYLDSPDAILPNVAFCEDGYSYITPAPVHVDVTGVTINTTATTINVGSTKTLVATVLPIDATDKSVTWSSSDSTIATVSNNGLVTALTTGATTITVTTHDGGYTASCAVTVEEVTFTTLAIVGATVISAETCNYNAIGDNSEDVTSSATWSITSGSQYATINPNNGSVTILNGANESNVTIQAEYAGLTATTNVTLTYVSGATSETETESTTDIGGNTTTVTTTVTTKQDGSKVEVTETVITDANGDLIGTSKSNKTINTDGSYNGTTTNYDAEGNPTDGSNVTGDTDGNVSTQTVEYDESGNTVVTGYDIDTSESESGKAFMSGGTNTEYYAFDLTHGFILDFDFTIDFTNQPPGQSDNHHNILTAKRANPEPWYGFQVRHSQTNKNIQLGTQFATGSNINTTINPSSTTGNVGSYSLRIIYDPTSTGTTFTCLNMANYSTVFTSALLFPDLEELKYLKITIGNATDDNGNPFRYSNITVHNFELKRLKHVVNPTITCTENVVTIACETVGANTYYRLNLSGDYSAYTTPITITADTVVQAYATNDGDTSDIVREDCEFVIPKPVISCDGEYVTITCSIASANIYYRLNESGSYSSYTSSFEITADTIVEAYAESSEIRSETAKETCIYGESVIEPVITCVNNEVTITCGTVGATIYYRLNESGDYGVYASLFEITADTVVEAYGELNGKTSTTAKTTCTLTDFSTKYFTIESLEDSNTIHLRRSYTGNTEYYSLDSGSTWSAITSGSGDKAIATINSGETMWIKCSTTHWASGWSSYNNFYSTKNIKAYGNVMSLLYGDNFKTATTIQANNALVGLFFGTSSSGGTNTKIVSAKNLVLPAIEIKPVCYNGMFRGCTALIDGPKLLPATTIYQDSYASMFEGCTSLKEGPEIMATTIASGGSTAMARMFCMNRSSKVNAAMTKSPILRVTNPQSVSNVYQDLFKGNGSLTEVTIYAEGNNLSFSNWLLNTNSGGVIKKKSTTSLTTGASGVPTGWRTEDID